MYSYYKKYAELPVYDDMIKVYSLEKTHLGFKILFDELKVSDIELEAESGLSRYHLKKFYKDAAHQRTRVWDLYIASKIIDNPKYKKQIPKMKKISLINPIHVRRVCREVGVDVEDIFDFAKGKFTKSQIERSYQNKDKTGLKYDVAVGITALYLHRKEQEPVKTDPINNINNPNTRKRMIYNDRIERYRSGYLPPVQQETGKTS